MNHMSFLANVTKVSEPTYYFHAKDANNWINAMKYKLDALEINGWK